MQPRAIALLEAAARAEPPLIPAVAWAPLARLAAAVPIGVQAIGFEVRLGADAGDVDLGCLIAHPARVGVPALLPPAEAASAWAGWRRFAVRWGERHGALWRRVPFAYLELDAAGAATPAPMASVFAAWDWSLDEMPGAGQPASPTPGDEALDTLALLRGAALEAAHADAVRGCFAALPPGGVVAHIGALLGRATPAVRLAVHVPRPFVANYLQSCGWAGAGELTAVIDALAAETEFAATAAPLQLDLDVLADGIAPRLGLTLRPPPGGGWRPLVARLIEADLCRRAAGEALLGWSGPVARDGIARWISHLKLTCAPALPAAVKAYVAVTPLSAAKPGA